ncbi:MAG: chromate transporter [Oscillospiraceae bacterium]
MKELVSIFLTFCKVGALTFGGGYAMLPIIQKEVVESKHWATEEEVMNYYAVGQCLPGIIAVNTAVFLGHKVKGKSGGVAAALGVSLPSLIVIVIIAAFIQNFIEVEAVQRAFSGIRIVVAALVVDAIVKMWKKSMKDVWCYLLYAVVFALCIFTNVSTILLILGAVLVGIAIQMRGGGEKA